MIGIDIIEISRFREMKNLEMFIRRVFTQNEADYFVSKGSAAKGFYESIAGHFAAKEAFSKALGSGVRGFSLSDIEVCHDELGKPFIKFGGMKVNAALSISHSNKTAVAVVYISEDIPGMGIPYYTGLEYYKSLIPVRNEDSNKGDCGKLFIIAGSRGMTGAAYLSCMGALRSGSGLVTLGVPESQQQIMAVKLTEAMTVPLPEVEESGTISLDALGEIKRRLNKSDVCVFGPGLSDNDDIPKLIDSLLSGSTDFVIDADGLNCISRDMDILRKHKNRKSCQVVITPHPGEMARLCGLSIEAVQNDRVGTARDFAEEFGVTVVLKGKDTVIANSDGGVHINNSGNAGMATGGTGDVLSGVIGSLMGQGLNGYDAAVLGVFLHGAAGDLARRDKGEHGLIATDLVEMLPEAFRLVNTAV